MNQLICISDNYEISESSNSEIPAWPIQDQAGRWHYSEFDGQRVAYDRARVEFGFLASRLSEDEINSLDMNDIPSGIFVAGADFYKSI